MDGVWTLADLAEATGIPARTIRFYIARGILEGPGKAGRGASYTAEHVARLEAIKRLQAQGRRLSEIAAELHGDGCETAVAEPTMWWQHAIGDDVTVMVKAGATPWRTRQIRAAMEEFARRLRADRKEEDE
jgi:DNA-binding transcriptional MerR regulator